MKTTLVATALVLATLTATPLVADTIPSRQWTTSWDTIERAYPTDEGYAIVLSEDVYQGHTSSCNAGRQFEVLLNDPNYEEKARTLLAAFLAGREITIWWDTSNTCRAHINRFQVR